MRMRGTDQQQSRVFSYLSPFNVIDAAAKWLRQVGTKTSTAFVFPHARMLWEELCSQNSNKDAFS
jgi:hypothetical protein